MKIKLFLLAPVLLALALGGCSAANNVGGFLSALSSGVTNPITASNIYELKNTYAATAELAVAYRKKCYGQPYAALTADPILKPLCQNRRAVVRQIQKTKAVASAAVKKADKFVKDNPTINASTVVNEAWSAVTAFQSAVPK
jgi:ElaB/YqjD/DUF883 family membrane-anchored ribosome-binding protein